MANIFMNWVHTKMIHASKATKADGTVSEFYNVSFPCAESKTGYASVSVSKGQVLAAKKKDGTVNPDYHSVLLGAPEKVRMVSIASKKTKKKTEFSKIEMTNQQIHDAYEAARAAYRQSQTTATADTASNADTAAANA